MFIAICCIWFIVFIGFIVLTCSRCMSTRGEREANEGVLTETGHPRPTEAWPPPPIEDRSIALVIAVVSEHDVKKNMQVVQMGQFGAVPMLVINP